MTLTAPVKWAQRKDSLYVTISLPDVKDDSIQCTSNKITFSGTSSGQKYQVELVLFKEIDTEGSILKVLPMNVQMKLNKKNQDEEFWPRLLSDKNLEKTNVKVDWDRYVDEDDEADGFDTRDLDGGYNLGAGGMGGMGGMPGMGGMGGMPGMGGMGGMAGMEEMLKSMGGMGGMGGMPGMGGMGDMGDDEGDSDDGDDADMPDLEPTEK